MRKRWTPGDMESAFGFAQAGMDREVHHWCGMNWLYPVLNLGAGKKLIPNTVPLDYPKWDGNKDPLPYEDESVGGVIAMHLLEHLDDPRVLIREVGRVLRVGCPFNILVPHGRSILYAQELDHVTPFALETWRSLLDNPYHDKHEVATFPFRLGANFLFGVDEKNIAIVTQLIKIAPPTEEWP